MRDLEPTNVEAAAPPAGEAPAPVVYVLKMFPRLSETFITNEILELKRRGLNLRVVSLMRPTGAVQSEEALQLAEQATYLPDPGTPDGKRDLWAAHRRLLNRDRGRYLRVLWQVTRRVSSKAWKRFFQAGALAELCLNERVAHIHAGFAHTPASVAWWASRLSGAPWSFAGHAKDLYLSDQNSIRNKMDAARFVWTCTEANGAWLRSLGSTTPVHVGYHGTDLARFAADGSDATVGSDSPVRVVSAKQSPSRVLAMSHLRILAVGRLVPKKGLSDLVRAAAILARRGLDFEVRFVGDGPERGALEALGRDLGVSERLLFTGALAPSDVTREYSAAAVSVLPCVVLDNGDRDGIPNALVESMAAGVPVVSTRVSAIPELIKDGETGLLVSPRSPEELAEAIAKTLLDPKAAARRAVAARADVLARFDLVQNSERLAGVLARHVRPTRCLYVSADLGIPIRGHKGASAHVRQIAGRLVDAGCETTVLTSNAGPTGEGANAFDVPIVEVLPPGILTALTTKSPAGRIKETLRELRRIGLNLSLGAHVSRLLREQKPDFVYERYSLSAFMTGLLARRRGIPWIVEVNAPLADEERDYRTLRLVWLTRRIERWVLTHADHVFVVSHAIRRWALEQGTHPDRVSVLSNGVDLRRFHRHVDGTPRRAEWGFDASHVVVAFSGSLKPWHGVGLLLSAFERAREQAPELRLVYIGDGPEWKALQKAVQKRGLADVVRFTGAIPQEEVPACLAAADILAAPYLPMETFYFSPLKVLEYLAVGRPIVASRLGEISDYVDSSAGRLVPAGSIESLQAALVELSGSVELRCELGKEAARRARGQDWLDRVETILRRVECLRNTRAPEETLRVGYVLKMFPRFSETFVVNEVLELERQGADIRTFSMKRPTGPRQDLVARVRARNTILPQARFLPSPRTVMAHLRCLARSPKRYFEALGFAVGRRDERALSKFIQAGVLADCCAREKIDHLHAHFASGPARTAKLASMISGLHFSFTAHAKDLYWQGHRHNESHKLKKRVKLARFVVVVNQENQRYIESLGFRVKEGRIRPIYIGLQLEDFPFRKPSERPRSPRPLVLGVGRLIEKKGFHVLIEALALLKQRGVPFRCALAGEGPEQAALQQLIDGRGLHGAVRLLGSVPLTRLREKYYSRARVLAQPCVIASDGDRDGIPTVLLEAMAMGVPVISTRVSGIPEAIEDNVDGFLTEAGEVEVLADRIQSLLADVSLADRIALGGRTRVERQFNQEVNAGILRKLFQRSKRGWPPLAESSGEALDVAEVAEVADVAEVAEVGEVAEVAPPLGPDASIETISGEGPDARAAVKDAALHAARGPVPPELSSSSVSV